MESNLSQVGSRSSPGMGYGGGMAYQPTGRRRSGSMEGMRISKTKNDVLRGSSEI